MVLAGTLFGGAGLKIIEWFLNSGTRKDTSASDLRKELRNDIDRLRADLKEESSAADEWQAKYWEIKASTLMANHKVDKTAEKVDELHHTHLTEDFKDITHPDR